MTLSFLEAAFAVPGFRRDRRTGAPAGGRAEWSISLPAAAGPPAGSPVLAPAVGDRQPPVPAERLHGDLGAGRGLAALVLGGIHHPQHPVDDRRVVTGRDQALPTQVAVDVADQDRV